jgi:hypothetical protein
MSSDPSKNSPMEKVKVMTAPVSPAMTHLQSASTGWLPGPSVITPELVPLDGAHAQRPTPELEHVTVADDLSLVGTETYDDTTPFRRSSLEPPKYYKYTSVLLVRRVPSS